MTQGEAQAAKRLRRILVGIEDVADCRVKLGLAAGLAAGLRMELAAVLLENQALLDLAELPIAREVVLGGRGSQPLTSHQLARSLKRREAAIRLEVERVARAASLSWTVSRLRIRREAEMVRLGEAGDIVALAGEAPSEIPEGSALLLQGRRGARLGAGPVVWLQGAGEARPPALVEHFAQAMKRRLLSCRRPTGEEGHGKLIDFLEANQAALLVVADEPHTLDLPLAARLAGRAPCPVLLLGGLGEEVPGEQ